MRVIITGGAGFVGSSLALGLRSKLGAEVLAVDNLRRRGSELNLERFRKHGIEFRHADIRELSDLIDIPGTFDLVIECSADASVQSGLSGSPAYLLGSNLLGAANCLEFARERAEALLFLSSSRVYSIESLRRIGMRESDTRYEITSVQSLPGISQHGISEDFSTAHPRSLYGTTKLASELLVQEYTSVYGLNALINRCGVIAGPGQFGRVDQGVFTLWMARHCFGLPLRYTGFGGSGKQVRDLLHPLDLVDLVIRQIECVDDWKGEVFNVGGGAAVSTSMVEWTGHCREASGREVPVEASPETSPVDIPLYLSDSRRATKRFDWTPQRDVKTIAADIATWISAHEGSLGPLFGLEA